MSFSSHSTNKTQNIYILGKSENQVINSTTIYEEKIYKTNFTEQSKTFVLSLHYNGDDSYLFVNGVEQLKFKSAINYKYRNLLRVGNSSSDCSLTNSTKTGLNGLSNDFPVDYVRINGLKTIYANTINLGECFTKFKILFIVKKSRM